MRYIKLETRPPTPNSPFPGTVNDATVLRQIAAWAPPGRGMLLDEMRLSMKILDALDGSLENRLVLEEAQWQMLCERLKIFPWSTADRRFIALADLIMQTQEVTLNGG